MREFLHKCRYFFKYAFFFSLFINILQLTFPIYMMQIYDKVLASFSMPTLYVITFAAVVALLVLAVLTWIRSRLMIRSGVELDRLLSQNVLYQNLLNACQPEGTPPGQGTLRDVNSLRNYLSGNAVLAFFDMPWMPIFFLLMFLLHPWLGYVGVAGGIITFFLGLLTERVTRGRLARAGRASAQANVFTGQVMRNASIVRALGMSGNVRDRWQKSNDTVMQLQTAASAGASLLRSFTSAFRMGLQVAIYGVGAYLAIKGECTAGVMIAASIIMGRAVGPISVAMATYSQSLNAHGAYQRLTRLFEDEKTETNMDLPDPVGEIACENVFFATGGRAIIKGVSFRMSAGQSLAIIGPSASGKSTLCRLLLNIWKPTTGKVRIDRADIQSWNPDKLGPFLGYLPQDCEIFAGTVAENIARMGNIESDRVIRAAKIAGAHEMILNLPRGYDTQMGDSGSALSGGQRQRIGLARAVYGDPRIVVLDEPNANLDEEGDISLQRAILNLRQLKTTLIIVTHKAQILNLVDNIMVIQDGQIGMCGRREDVLRDLTNMQKSRQTRTQQPETDQIEKQQEALQSKKR